MTVQLSLRNGIMGYVVTWCCCKLDLQMQAKNNICMSNSDSGQDGFTTYLQAWIQDSIVQDQDQDSDAQN